MADDDRPSGSKRNPEDVDHDRVDLTWVISGLRRLGLRRPPRPTGREAHRAQDVDEVGPERPNGPESEEVDYDKVDVSWFTGGLRRVGLLGPARPAAARQPALPWPAAARSRLSRWRSATQAGADPAEESLSSAVIADPRARALLVAAVLVYCAVFLRWSFRQHDGLGTLAFDLGIFDQGVWLLSRFKSPFTTVNGRNLFGDHTSFILLPWVAVYWVIPSAKVLLAGQTLALALGALPTFLIAREKLRNELFAALIAVAYLLQPVLGWTNLSEGFHPDAFAIPLVLFAFWFLLRHRWVGYWICVVALLLVKEDVALLTFGLGIYVALRHDRRVGWITCGASAAYFVVAYWLIIPGFLGAGSVYTRRIVFGGPGALLGKVFTDPGAVLSELISRPRAWYIWQLFAPLGFLAWLAPSVLLVAVGPLLLNIVSGVGYQFDVRYSYSTVILPVIVVASIMGVASMPRRNHRALVGVMVAASIVCAFLWSPLPGSRVNPYIADPGSAATVSFRRAERLLPEDAVVSAYYGFVPQISHRDEVYVFPNPWKASNWGTFDQEGQRLSRADRVQYILVRSTLDPEPKAVLDSVAGEFDTLYHDDEVQLLRRRP